MSRIPQFFETPTANDRRYSDSAPMPSAPRRERERRTLDDRYPLDVFAQMRAPRIRDGFYHEEN